MYKFINNFNNSFKSIKLIFIKIESLKIYLIIFIVSMNNIYENDDDDKNNNKRNKFKFVILTVISTIIIRFVLKFSYHYFL